jgi:adenosylhomocysteine nucleosidase
LYKKIGVISAVSDESEPFFKRMQTKSVTKKGVWEVREGELAGKSAAVLFGGVCRANSAAAVQMLIDCFDVDAVIMSGTAGAMAPEPRIGDVIIVTETCCHDIPSGTLRMFFPFIKDEVFVPDDYLLECAKKSGKKLPIRQFYGRSVSGEFFVADKGRDEINRRFSPMCVDMETAGVAQICFLNKIPFLAVRAISDTEAESGISTFEQNLKKASQNACEAVMSIIEEI